LSATNKAKNKVVEVDGEPKETAALVAGDTSPDHEGHADQAKSHLKDAGEKGKPKETAVLVAGDTSPDHEGKG
jgi:uncharacterized protein YjbJ (UPF0337 family)